jgi:glycolate oxidase iron-sulfur subunit
MTKQDDIAAKSTSELLSTCVHCGFCLDVCPTYQLTGDENNSPRGRLRLWKEEAEGRLERDPWTDFYTSECVGCLACETACAANVPYGEILYQIREQHVSQGRNRLGTVIRIADWLARRTAVMNAVMMPLRFLRRVGLAWHPKLFPGKPSVVESTAAYARRMVRSANPTGPCVALFTGCLMESAFREINFATVRVLVENNVRVIVPESQGCCGAFQEHIGTGGVAAMWRRNRDAFAGLDVEAVLTNSAGCGLALGHSLAKGAGTDDSGSDNSGSEVSPDKRPHGLPPVRDVIDFLGDLGPVRRNRPDDGTRLYVDLPCHRVHGQGIAKIPDSVLDATGYRWELAPMARDCCGAGGTYHLEKPENAAEILRRKATFLSDAPGDRIVVVTTNHVCMMQWNSARKTAGVTRPYQVRHLIQLLDPSS